MSSYYQNNSRPQPHVSIPPPASDSRLYRSPSTGWLPSVYNPSAPAPAPAPQQHLRHNSNAHSTYDGGGRAPARHDSQKSEKSQFLTAEPYTPYTAYPVRYYPSERYPSDNGRPPPQLSARPASYIETSSVSTSSYNPDASSFKFPEPELHRSISVRETGLGTKPPNRQAQSDVGPGVQLARVNSSHSSFAPSMANDVSNVSILQHI